MNISYLLWDAIVDHEDTVETWNYNIMSEIFEKGFRKKYVDMTTFTEMRAKNREGDRIRPPHFWNRVDENWHLKV